MSVLSNSLLLRFVVKAAWKQNFSNAVIVCHTLAALNRATRDAATSTLEWVIKKAREQDPKGLRDLSMSLSLRFTSDTRARGAISALDFYIKLNPGQPRRDIILWGTRAEQDFASVGLIRCASTLCDDDFSRVLKRAMFALTFTDITWKEDMITVNVLAEMFKHKDVHFILGALCPNENQWKRGSGCSIPSYYFQGPSSQPAANAYFQTSFDTQAALLQKIKASGSKSRTIANMVGMQLVLGIGHVPAADINRELQTVLDLGACDGDWHLGRSELHKFLAQLLIEVFADDGAKELIRKVYALIGVTFGKTLWLTSLRDSQWKALTQFFLEARIVPGTENEMDVVRVCSTNGPVILSRWNRLKTEALDMRNDVFKERRIDKRRALEAKHAARQGF